MAKGVVFSSGWRRLFRVKNKDYNEDGRHSVIVEMKKDWFKTMGIRKPTSSRL